MPKITAGSPLLAGFSLNTPLKLPKLFGPVWGDIPEWSEDAWADANYSQWSQITGHVVGRIGTKYGVPNWNLPGFGKFFSELPNVTPSDVATLALGAAAKAVSIGLAQAATAVPILGWVVQLGIGIFQGVQLAIEYTKNKKKDRPPSQAIVFSADDNDEMANQLLSLSKEQNWTPLFQPPSTSGEWTMMRVTWTPGGAGQGWAFGTRNEIGRGLLPGLAECVGTLSTGEGNFNYQFPKTRSNTGLSFGAEYDVPPLDTTGSLTPSSRQFSILLWQTLMKPSVAMYRIDPYKLVSQWHDYYQGLREFAATLRTDEGVKNVNKDGTWERGSNPKLPYNEAMIATTYLPFTATKSGGVWFSSPDNNPNFDTAAQIAVAPSGVSLDALFGVIGSDLTYTYADLVKYVCKLHIERSLVALSTIICAYVDENAPLLRASGAHKKRWEDMRRLLLRNRAVHRVEPEMIPDAEYRSAVIAAQHANTGLGFSTGPAQSVPAIPDFPGEAPTVDGRPLPPMPPSPGPGMPRLPPPLTTRRSPPLASKIMFGASLAAAAAAGGIILYDRYGRPYLQSR